MGLKNSVKQLNKEEVMKKAQYRIENGNVYVYDHDSNAYIFYAKTYALTKEELKEIKRNT